MKLQLLAACGLSLGALLPTATTTFGAHHRSTTGTNAPLNGTIQATETRLFGNPDVGAPYTWKGKGTVGPMGAVTATGTNHGVGFIMQGTPTGTVALSNQKGSITLKVSYDQTRGFAPLPRHGTYTIDHGTGAYTGLTGTGSLTRDPAACPGVAAGSPGGFCPVGTSTSVTYTFSGSGAVSSHRTSKATMVCWRRHICRD